MFYGVVPIIRDFEALVKGLKPFVTLFLLLFGGPANLTSKRTRVTMPPAYSVSVTAPMYVLSESDSVDELRGGSNPLEGTVVSFRSGGTHRTYNGSQGCGVR